MSEEYPYIPDIVPVIGGQDDDNKNGILIARRLIRDHFKIAPEIPYEDDGAFCFNLVPLKQLGEYWYIRDDPEAFYAVPFATFYGNREQTIITLKERKAAT